MIVNLVDGTYELFRHFYGLRRFTKGADKPLGAVAGVLTTVLQMLEQGSTHLGVATDHVIESFRNELWAGYKTGEGIDPALWDQFGPLDDALAAAAAMADADPAVAQVRIWTPDKDLAQCVRGRRVVQVDRRAKRIFDEAEVVVKFGVAPESIPDWLALVGDSADGYPGVPGWGAKSAAGALARFRHLEAIPRRVGEWPAEARGA